MTDISTDGFISAERDQIADPADYFALLKPRVMSLVIFTAITGMILAPGSLHPLQAIMAVLAIAVGAGASGALNMWYDRDIDQKMRRTQNRPIAAGRISPENGLIFGLLLSGLSVMTLGLALHWFAAIGLAVTIAYYAIFYTMWLKRRTPQNIVIGGAAGAFPPILGWICVTESLDWGAVSLFALIFFWTPPHFWALALYRHQDYQAANVPMLPVTAGQKVTRYQIMIYAFILIPISLLPMIAGVASLFYGGCALLATSLFALKAWHLYRAPSPERAMKLFKQSIFLLFGLFVLLLCDHVFLGDNLSFSSLINQMI